MAKQQGYKFGIEKLNVLYAVFKLLEPFVKHRGMIFSFIQNRIFHNLIANFFSQIVAVCYA